MSDDPTPDSAVARLVAAAGIGRILFVDDAFAADVEKLLETLAGLTPEERADVTALAPDSMGVADVWQQAVRDQWDTVGETEHASLVDKAYAIASGTTPVAAGAMQALQALLPDLPTVGLSRADWSARQDELLASAHETPTLILFDQDFSHEGGANNDGQRLIADLETTLQNQDLPDTYYGLLTNTVEVDDEDTQRDGIVSSGGLDPARFVLISKQNLADEELTRFGSRLRTILLAPLFAGLVGAVTGELQTTQELAIGEIRKIPPEDLEHIVVRSSLREGLWEPDTLVRVVDALSRTEARERLRKADRVDTLTRRLRDISAIDPRARSMDISGTGDPGDKDATAPTGDAPTPVAVPFAVSISHKELYDPGEHVNSLHLPIEIGDVLKRQSGKRYVVVAQPCDLMVRLSGEREPEVSHLLVAEITLTGSQLELFREFRLPYFDPETGEDAFVRLARPSIVRSHIIDSCVLNADGRARLVVGADPPDALLPHWKARQDRLSKLGASMFTRLSKVKDAVDSETKQAITGHLKGDVFKPLAIDIENKSITWDCQRVGRIGDAYARALLNRYSQYFARDAYLHDLART